MAANFVEIVLRVKDLASNSINGLIQSVDKLNDSLKVTASTSSKLASANTKLNTSISKLQPSLDKEAVSLERLVVVLSSVAPALDALGRVKKAAATSSKQLGDSTVKVDAIVQRADSSINKLTKDVQTVGSSFNAASINAAKFNAALAVTPQAGSPISNKNNLQPNISKTVSVQSPLLPDVPQQAAAITTLTAQLNQLQASVAKLQSQQKKGTSTNNQSRSSFTGLARSIASIQGPLGPVAGRVSSLGGTITSLGFSVGATAIILSAFTGILVKGLGAAANYERQVLKIGAVLNATQGIVGLTTSQVLGFAEALERNTLATGEQARDAAAVLLTFRQIKGSDFNQILNLAQSLSSVLGESLTGSAKKLGRAFEDPVQGLESLREAGVFFTNEEKKLLAVFKETNATAAAHDLLLRKLSGTFNDIATKEATGLAGSFQQATEAVNRFFVAVGSSAVGGLATKVLNGLASAVDNMATALLSADTTLAKLSDGDLEFDRLVLEGRIATLKESVGKPVDETFLGGLVRDAKEALLSLDSVKAAVAATGLSLDKSTPEVVSNLEKKASSIKELQDKNKASNDGATKKSELVRAKEQAERLAQLEEELDTERVDQASQTRKQELEAERAFADKKLALQQSLQEQGLISAQDFVIARASIQQKSLDEELISLQKQRTSLEKELTTAQSRIDLGADGDTLDDTKETIKLREQIRRIDAQSTQIRANSGKLEIETQSELIKLANERRLILLNLQKEQADRRGFSLSQEEVRERVTLEAAPERAKVIGDVALTIFDAEIEAKAAEQTFNELDKIVNQRRARLNLELQKINNLEAAGLIAPGTANEERIDAEQDFARAVESTINAQERLAEVSGNEALINSVKVAKEEMVGLNIQTTAFRLEVQNAVAGDLANLFEEIRTGVDGVGSAFQRFAESLKNSIAQIIQQDLAKRLTASIIPDLAGGFSAIADFFGGSSSSAAVSGVGKVISVADGGLISGPGTGTSDSIRARLSNGEYVVPARVTSQWLPALESMRQGKFINYLSSKRTVLGPTRIPSVARFADGGLVSTKASDNRSSSINVSMVVNAQDASSFSRSENQLIGELARKVRYIDRRNN